MYAIDTCISIIVSIVSTFFPTKYIVQLIKLNDTPSYKITFCVYINHGIVAISLKTFSNWMQKRPSIKLMNAYIFHAFSMKHLDRNV